MITDWDDAYANGAHIAGAASYPPRWAAKAAAFRAAHDCTRMAYGSQPRMQFDLFRPAGTPRGLAVFVHGGYWKAFDQESWSHLAAGALARGYAVALPGYVLAPEARIADITRQIAQAIDHVAGLVDGPIHLSGHSAGGHLVARMACTDMDLACATRLGHILSISGLHDLRPLLNTAMNADLRLDMEEATTESPALLRPRPGTRLTAWVGGDERPEFVRQAQLQANIWAGLGAETGYHCAEGLHHFNVIDALADPASAMMQAWLG